MQLAMRARKTYEAGLTRGNFCERGIQTKRDGGEQRLREQIYEMSEQLDELSRPGTEQLPWWTLCLRMSDSRSTPGPGAAAGAALIRAAAAPKRRTASERPVASPSAAPESPA